MNRREVIKLGFLTPLLAVFERWFGWLLPDDTVRGWHVYLDGTEEYVSFRDVSEVDFRADEPFQAGFWFRMPRGSDAEVTTPGKKDKGIPKLRFRVFKFLRRRKVDDGKWHHIVCQYDGSKTGPVRVHNTPKPRKDEEIWI